ncbi:MAG TPA: HD domain-containing protein [archaeon]|nr:HD domain-containing protein [archaeon]
MYKLDLDEFEEKFSRTFSESSEIKKAIEMLSRSCKISGLDEKSYISHGLGVASITLGLGLEREVVIAALIHNVTDHGISSEQVEAQFGKRIVELIESKSRFEKALLLNPGESEAATKKLLIVLTTNPDVVMLQLAEMLDKLRNIEKTPQEQRKEFIKEIKEIYAPLSHKLGIYSLSSEMNELSFKYENPTEHTKIENAMNAFAQQASESINNAHIMLDSSLKKAGIEATIAGRVKTVFSTYSKMKRKQAGIEQIYDLLALRVITDSIKECYEALGIIHSIWKPIPGEFDDYIAKPKENGYRSLHTSVYTDEGTPLEIQLRTKEMHDFAELGIASHWRYKGEKKQSGYDRKIEWIKQVLDWERSYGKGTDADIFGKEVFAMTPKGQVIELPEGSSVIDFAYAVHTDIGNRCRGAKINGKLDHLNSRIQNGDVVEILTSSKQKPQMNWLAFAKTEKAKQKIMATLNVLKKSSSLRSQKTNKNVLKTNNNRVRLAKCCSPLPGDQIIGVRTTKRKISVHRMDCDQVQKLGQQKIEVQWNDKSGYYDAEIVVEAADRSGILKDILEIFSQNKVYVSSTNARSSPSNTITCVFGIRLQTLSQLEQIKKNIRHIAGVNSVHRS